MIAPSDMLLFVAVVRHGSFTAAGRALGITKQSVSERIGKLERELGVRLLERTTRKVRATDAGAGYYERCSLIAAQIDEANRQVQHVQSAPVGWLRVSAPVLYGRRYLGPIVADFLARYPELRIDLVLTDRRVNLVEEGFDLAVRTGPQSDSSLAARRLDHVRVHLVASPRYLAQHGAPRRPRDLAKAKCIARQPAPTWNLGGERVKIEPVLVVSDLEAACHAALDHVGVARLPSILVDEHVARGALRIVLPRATIESPIYALFPSRQYTPPKVRLFVAALAVQGMASRGP